MASLTQRIANIQQLGPVLEVVLAPSVLYLKNIGISVEDAPKSKLLAMIDTGATSTVIQAGIGQQLGINPIGYSFSNTPSHTKIKSYQFDIQLLFPNDSHISSLIVTELPLQGQHIQCLIGRDILSFAVFIYTGYDNSFTLSF